MTKIVNKQNIKIFFQERANTHDKNNPLKSVIYQDKNPLLAKKRDKFEKKKIYKILGLSRSDVVLDIACGIGRWADLISKVVKKYVGIDYMDDFIKIAKKNHINNKKVHFICADGTQLYNSKVNYHSPYTIILISGFFVYINKKDSYEVLRQILKVSCDKTKIIIREPIGVKKEIILDNVWSEEMETYYSARYRTQKEFKKMFKDVLFKEGYELFVDERLYPQNLNNRKDTAHHLFCLKKTK